MTAQTSIPTRCLTISKEFLPAPTKGDLSEARNPLDLHAPDLSPARSSWNDLADKQPEDETLPSANGEALVNGDTAPVQSYTRAVDDPLRVYLQQMGPLPLLSREEEIEICRRIESAQTEIKRIVLEFGFACKEHIALARKLLSTPPKERFDRLIVDSKLEHRAEHLKLLDRLVTRVEAWDQELDSQYQQWRDAFSAQERERISTEMRKLNSRIRPGLSLIAITKVIRSLRTVKHHELSEFIFTFQYVPQRRSQWCNSGSHRNKNQIASFYFIDPKPTPADLKQFDFVANTHIVDDAAGACFLFHKHFQITIRRRARESKVSRFLTFHTQNRNLPGHEINRPLGSQIE